MSATRFMNALGRRRVKGDKVDMEVEEKKLEPNLKQGSANDFPDLSGDGDVTMKDILIGKGVIKKGA